MLALLDSIIYIFILLGINGADILKRLLIKQCAQKEPL